MIVVGHVRRFASDCVRELGYAVIVPAVIALVVSLGSQSQAASASSASKAPAAVALADARFEPTVSITLPRGASVTLAEQCDGGTYFSDFGAYRGNGRALGAQRTNKDETLDYWRGNGGRVTFDGVTFENHTRGAVIVAGWCE